MISSTINKMRPEQLYQHVLLLRERCGVDFFLKESVDFVDVPCPACGMLGGVVFRKYGYSHAVCDDCRTMYVSPRPTETKVIRYYSDYEAPKIWNQILVETNETRKRLQHRPRVEKLIGVAKEIGSEFGLCVELGAGNGNFSRALSDTATYDKVVPFDVSDVCLESCRKQGLEYARIGTVEDVENESADCIVFNDLIEHVFEPIRLMSSCFAKLRKNGILFITTPNGEGFDFKIFGKDTVNVTPPEHLQYFNPDSIARLAHRSGFKIYEVSTPGILDGQIVRRELDNAGKNLARDEPYLNYILEEKDDPVLLENFQRFLAENNLSSHLMMIAYKE